MIKPVIIFSYIKSIKLARYLIIAVSTLLLTGCLGGTMAQQIARSIATSVADNAIANAMDVNEDTQAKPKQSIALEDRQASDLALVISRTSFKKAEIQSQNNALEANEKETHIMRSSALVHVKVFNIVIGKEKNTYFEHAKLAGALNLPQQEEWHLWQVATGEIIHVKTPITFIVPPNLGKPISGTTTIVELANIGGINIARYHDKRQKLHHAMDLRSAPIH
ncbi:MAG: hypothetical protein ACMZ63_02410 [Methylotenera sp.]